MTAGGAPGLAVGPSVREDAGAPRGAAAKERTGRRSQSRAWGAGRDCGGLEAAPTERQQLSSSSVVTRDGAGRQAGSAATPEAPAAPSGSGSSSSCCLRRRRRRPGLAGCRLPAAARGGRTDGLSEEEEEEPLPPPQAERGSPDGGFKACLRRRGDFSAQEARLARLLLRLPARLAKASAPRLAGTGSLLLSSSGAAGLVALAWLGWLLTPKNLS